MYHLKKITEPKALLLFLEIEFLFELVYATTSINKPLFSGIKWMAFGANLHLQFFFNGTASKTFPASASYF